MKEKSNKNYASFIIICICIIFFATVPFHYVPSHLMVFPKENLTLSYTIVTDEDIEKLVDRFNKSSLFERVAMNNEPIVRKLMEKGLIFEKENQSANETNIDSDEQWNIFWNDFTNAVYSKNINEIRKITSEDFFDGGGGNTVEEWLENIVFVDDDTYNSFLKEIENGIRVYEENYRATNKGIYFKYEDEKWLLGGVEGD